MRAARLAFVALKAGAAWLGLGIVLADDSPGPTLGVVGALVALVGGRAGRSSTAPTAPRIAACLAPVLVARVLAGTGAAALAAACVGAGWWLRLRLSDAVVVLAAIGIAVVATSAPSWRLILLFAALGAVTTAFEPVWDRIRRYARTRRARRAESPAKAVADVTPAAAKAHGPASLTRMADGRPLVPARNGR